jgi:chaperone BCS1
VLIDDGDTLYYQFIKWISAQRKVETYRELQATTKSSRSFDDEYDSDDDFSDVLDDAGLFSYEKWAGSTPLSYEPTLTDDSFVYNGQHFYYEKQTIENKYQQQDDRYVIIRCMGRSTQPIKDFLGHVKDWSSKRVNNNTNIYRSRYGGRYEGAQWERQATRPARPVSTVSLDEVQKTQIVADINEYLHPATAKWYAARGIPHRRGYLFHGPPGTGKTSLSFALAGIFGLSIYCASLSETELKESDLASLFTQLPSRCIVLLEDIDSAGIRREKGSGDSDASDDDDSDSESDEPVEKRNKSNSLQYFLPQIVAKWIANPTGDNTNAVLKALAEKTAESDHKGGKSNISLAGLLNIIDGAASHEVNLLHCITCSIDTNSHAGSGLDHDYQLPREIGLCFDPSGARRSPDQVHARNARANQ